MCHRIVLDFKTIFLRLQIQYRHGFLAVAAFVVEIGDFLALQGIHAAFLHSDVLDFRRVLAPVIGDQRENPRKDFTICRVGSAITH